MILTPEQRMAAMNGLDVDAPMGRGAAIGKQWPSGVLVYEIDNTLGKTWGRTISFLKGGRARNMPNEII